ncbi:hypothetical protein HYDPIDRAFT_105030 [Hydnomerulius pinastri MD-312]|nr:hypothetical protein HYDPIDRAFT_105030 [Hydnomerulius pinastri MD-312]
MLPTLSKVSRCPSLAALSRRSASSKASKGKATHYDTKMEALVSLYHQTDRFITPENLSEAIDEAFTRRGGFADEQKKHSLAEIYQMRQYQKESPKFFLGRDEHYPSMYDSETMGPGWTESKAKRVNRVYQALMGTQKDGKPSWTAVKENAERVKSQIDADSQIDK